MKQPNLPYNLTHKLSKSQTNKAKKLLQDNSQRYVANYFKVSRYCILYNCYENIRIKAIDYAKKSNYKYPITKERKRELAYKLYHLKNSLFPKEMKLARKKAKNIIGKDYFKDYMKNYKKQQRLFDERGKGRPS